MNKTIAYITLLCSLLSGEIMAQTQKFIPPASTTEGPWSLYTGTDGNGDYLMIGSLYDAQKYYMYQKDVSPSRFALTYNTLKDAWINDDKFDLYIYYTGSTSNATIVKVQLVGK